jgi:competence protein ComEC
MVEQSRSRGRAEAWRPWIAAGRRPALAWPQNLRDFARRAAQRVHEWATAEVAPGRLVPWLAIAFGCGTIIYFAVEQEPAPWAAALLLAATVAAAILCRHRPFALPATVGIAAVAAGFATASIKREIIAHPVLAAPVWNVELAGFVEVREERERSDRIVVRLERIDSARLNERLERVRVSVRKGTAPAVGSFVEFKARLSPPLEPLRPGGYDFARDMYFQRIGASGFVLGRIRTAEAPRAPGLRLRYATIMDGMREAIDKRIRAVLPGDKGAIASALITGKRDAISTPVNEAMYVSGLAHVLSISGYHMAVVAGVMFFAFRALFALMPAFSSRHPIKKWAALAALIAAAFYLLLSGAEVATQRSFIMIGIVLIGVMVDRPTLTFRTLTVAAFGVLLLAPEAVVHPSFQMSFAATLALVAGYQQGLPWMSKGGDRRPVARFAARRHCDHPVRRLSLSSHISLWRDRESHGDAGGVGLGHAGGDSRPDKHAARLRQPVVAVDGAGHRLDDLRRAVGHEFSWSAGPDGGVRHRPAAAVHRRARRALLIQDALAVHRRLADRRRHCADDSGAPARCADRRRRQRHRHPR